MIINYVAVTTAHLHVYCLYIYTEDIKPNCQVTNRICMANNLPIRVLLAQM